MIAPTLGQLFRVTAELDGEPHPFAGALVTYLAGIIDPEDDLDTIGILHLQPDELAGMLAQSGKDWPIEDLVVEGLATFNRELELEKVSPRETVERPCPSCLRNAVTVRNHGAALVFGHDLDDSCIFELPELALTWGAGGDR